MALSPGRRLGPYEVTSAIGAGGMGEVYRARDPRIGREVAIKVLPAAFSKDLERLRRFQQEAHSAGVLNHPNILAVYDVGAENESSYIVSELLDGETLREKLRNGPLPIRKATEYGLQIAHGLAAAHEKGITHRDLKPENLFVTRDGRVKILDFGLAKLTERIGSAPKDNSILQTVAAESDPGIVLGTVGYMSPEQVRGLSVDSRSDIFSFGAVLYEMFTGIRAFSGRTQADTLSAILQTDPPDLAQINPETPAAAERVVRHCLEKDAAQRFQTAQDLAFALDSLSGFSDPALSSHIADRHRAIGGQKLWWGVVLVACVIGVLGSIFLSSRNHQVQVPPRVLQLSLNPPAGVTLSTWPVVSPDGAQVVYTANDPAGTGYLWLRSLSSTDSRQLAGTEDAQWPFWSPDCKYIAFFASGKLKKMQLPDGPPQALCSAGDARGGTWNQDGTILFAPSSSDGLFRVSSTGGDPAPVTHLSKGEVSHRWPAFLPNGRDFLFYVFEGANPSEREGIYLSSLDSKQKYEIGNSLIGAAFVPPGLLVFQQNTTLMAQEFDLKDNQLKGDPIPLTDHLAVSFDYTGSIGFSASPAVIACLRSSMNTRLVWYDRTGKQKGSVGEPDLYIAAHLSADDKKTAVELQSGLSVTASTDLWVLDALNGRISRLTFGNSSTNTQPVWSADGTKVFFASSRSGIFNLYSKDANGTGQEQELLKTGEWLFPDDSSRDGRFLLYESISPKTNYDVWVLPLSGTRSPFPLLNSPALEGQSKFSPNGRYVAYTSDETGRPEIYVQDFPDASQGRWQVSNGSGVMAAWSGDGKELFYLTLDRKLMEVDTSKGFPAAAPKILFSNVPIRSVGAQIEIQYAVSADAQRFLIVTPVDDPSRTSITIISNWQQLLKK